MVLEVPCYVGCMYRRAEHGEANSALLSMAGKAG